MVYKKCSENEIYNVLSRYKGGATITELTTLSKIPRSKVRIQLARLEGAKIVQIRRIGMAKVYNLIQNFHHTNEGGSN